MPVSIPSLHLIGNEDRFKPYSERLLEHYDPSQRKVLYHGEGHNIPSIRTELYPEIKAWIQLQRS
jgi:hypothetical protein